MNRFVRWLRWLFKKEPYHELEKPTRALDGGAAPPPDMEQQSFTSPGVTAIPEEKVVPEEKASGDVVTPHDPRVTEIKKAIEKAAEKDKRKK
jgi:hypothetical protein